MYFCKVGYFACTIFVFKLHWLFMFLYTPVCRAVSSCLMDSWTWQVSILYYLIILKIQWQPTLSYLLLAVSQPFCLCLTAHNWQKWKRVFLTFPCHEIYRDKAVGLKSCKYTWKFTIHVNMWNLGQFRENLIFCQ